MNGHFSGDILSGFLHRIGGHLTQLGHLLHTLFDMVGTGSDIKNEEITRDDFGLHAMIVVITSTGKVKKNYVAFVHFSNLIRATGNY